MLSCRPSVESRCPLQNVQKDMQRLYETMYILRSDVNDHDADQAIAKYKTFLQDQGAEDITIQHRGKRRLAYEIKKHREGIYIQMNYAGNPGLVEDLERSMRLSEEVIRYLTVRLEPEELESSLTTLPPEPFEQPTPAPKPATAAPVLASAAAAPVVVVDDAPAATAED
ncbi:MAG: 30S ribosomal protein S6 [Pseudanabaenaceae cyanobacterium]